jgi:hypothetical protein
MRKGTLIFGLYMLSATAFGQTYKGQIDITKVPQPQYHYLPEYNFEVATDSAKWKAQKPGMHVSFASTEESYFRNEVPNIPESQTFEATAWRGERVNALILVWSPDTLNQVRFTLNDLVSAKGNGLSKKNVQANLVRYVVSNYPYNANQEVTCGESPYKAGFLMPDRFEALERFDLPGYSLRPVWITFDIPAGTEAGMYKGVIEVKSEKYQSVLNVNLKVQNQVLPKPHDWKFRLDLWQNPVIVARFNHLKPWSDEHMALLKKHLQLYADAGGKFITTYAVHSPWADNSYRIEEGMIEWIKQKNGSWKFDYTIFDKYVQLAMSVGIDKAITIYTPIPWGFRFRYLDEKTGNYIYESWAPDSKDFREHWNTFLTDLKKHLEQKGWFDKTYIGINENEMKETLAAIKFVKAHSSKWKVTYAGNWHPELDTLLNDYCFLYGNEANQEQVKQRSAKGYTTTYYVCCNPPKPNDFLFSPPVEGRWLSWYSAAFGYDGFLRWAYDAWVADPSRDARHAFWPAGDCFMVYPGGNSGVRFEKLREGIAEYEKIRILRELVAKSNDKEVKNLMKEFDQHLQTFVNEKTFETNKLINDLSKGKKLIDAISDRLSSSTQVAAAF